jgi:hypothetical protein
VNDFGIAAITEQGFDFLAGMTGDATRFFGIVVGQAARNVVPVFANARDHRPAFKFAGHALDADRQQALTLAAQWFDCALTKYAFPITLESYERVVPHFL